jgi:galactitol-specific phosphotransferase system IIB component
MAKSVACDCGRGVSGSSQVERNLQNLKEKENSELD